jgi:uncharacterized membrane protein YidH (DUF202 family)
VSDDAGAGALPTEAAYERDPGLAAERTELAWGRSAMSLFACGAAVSRGLPGVTGAAGRPWLGLSLLGLGLVVWLAGVPLAAERAREGRTGRRRPARLHELRPLAWGTAVVGSAGFVIAAFLIV